MTASDALMLPVLSTSLDQVQTRYGECISTAPLHAHTVTLHNNPRSETISPAAVDFTRLTS